MDVRFCEICHLPLDSLYIHLLILIHSDGTATSHSACAVCDAMVKAADTPYFDKLERDYERYCQRIKNLRPNGDYLAD